MRLYRLYKQLPAFTKSFYFLAGMGFLVWMLFFDAEDWVTQYRLSRRRRQLQQELSYYQQQVVRLRAEREELLNNEELLEKFAREHFYMHKPSEDVYIIID